MDFAAAATATSCPLLVSRERQSLSLKAGGKGDVRLGTSSPAALSNNDSRRAPCEGRCPYKGGLFGHKSRRGQALRAFTRAGAASAVEKASSKGAAQLPATLRQKSFLAHFPAGFESSPASPSALRPPAHSSASLTHTFLTYYRNFAQIRITYMHLAYDLLGNLVLSLMEWI